MEIKTKVISREIIKPSYPTPKSLQIHRLSFLDQITPLIFIPFVYFYAPNTKITSSQKSNHLKKSLSQVLTRFYPLAGRLVGNLYVDCKDGGAAFVEAEANCDFSQAITNPNPRDLTKFLPCKLDESHDFCLAVQATYFRFGGAAVGILISHKIADASSFVSFVNAWSDVARDGDNASGGGRRPEFAVAAAYFPPRDIPVSKPVVKEEIALRVFKFSAAKIDILRERYAAAGRPSRVEALSAFIWDRFISATGIKSDPDKIYTVTNTVNLRTQTDPPLSGNHFGNLFWTPIAQLAVGDGCVELMVRVREAVKAVDGAYVAELREGEKHLSLMRETMAQADRGELVTFSFPSLCRFPLYEADFGWGEPVWIGFAGFAYKNLVIFMDSRNGGGIEAWIHLRREDMERFEGDLELHEFLSSDKSFFISRI